MVTGKPMEIEAGPNWNDDLGGSPIYAENDPDFRGLTADQPAQLPPSSAWFISIFRAFATTA
jgi:nitrate reductase / nitrite oxidoreductase, beta subunit